MSIRETKPVAKIDTYEKKVFFTTEVRKGGEELYTEEQVLGLIRLYWWLCSWNGERMNENKRTLEKIGKRCRD